MGSDGEEKRSYASGFCSVPLSPSLWTVYHKALESLGDLKVFMSACPTCTAPQAHGLFGAEYVSSISDYWKKKLAYEFYGSNINLLLYAGF